MIFQHLSNVNQTLLTFHWILIGQWRDSYNGLWNNPHKTFLLYNPLYTEKHNQGQLVTAHLKVIFNRTNPRIFSTDLDPPGIQKSQKNTPWNPVVNGFCSSHGPAGTGISVSPGDQTRSYFGGISYPPWN